MKRRDAVLALMTLGVAPSRSFAQLRSKIRRIGVLSTYPSSDDPQFEAFKRQLHDLGHVDGKTITIDYRSSEGKYDRLPVLAADLVRSNVDIIMAVGGSPAANAARNAAGTIPVVFQSVADPVGQGFVTTLGRPGGNVTGTSSQNPEVSSKTLALIKEIVPSAKRVAILMNPTNSSHSLVVQETQAAAKTLRLETTVVSAKTAADFEGAFAEIVRDHAAGVVILSENVFNIEAGRLAALAVRHRLPTIGGDSPIPDGGCLMSFGANRMDLIRRAAALVDKILKGSKPADLPVEQPTKFELVINLKTAKALGLKIPRSVLLRADRVIE